MEKGHTMVGWDFHPQLTSAFDAARQILPALALATPGVRGLRGWFNRAPAELLHLDVRQPTHEPEK